MLFKLSTEWDAQGCWTFFSFSDKSPVTHNATGIKGSAWVEATVVYLFQMHTGSKIRIRFTLLIRQWNWYFLLNFWPQDNLGSLVNGIYLFSKQRQTLEIQTEFRPSVLIHLKFCDSFSMFPAPWGVHLQVGTKCVT